MLAINWVGHTAAKHVLDVCRVAKIAQVLDDVMVGFFSTRVDMTAQIHNTADTVQQAT